LLVNGTRSRKRIFYRLTYSKCCMNQYIAVDDISSFIYNLSDMGRCFELRNDELQNYCSSVECTLLLRCIQKRVGRLFVDLFDFFLKCLRLIGCDYHSSYTAQNLFPFKFILKKFIIHCQVLIFCYIFRMNTPSFVLNKFSSE
jgi:hypothetical protein